MPPQTQRQAFGIAADRHFRDAEYLRQSGRLPSADHLYGFAAECALKNILVLLGLASMATQPNGKDAKAPWVPDPTDPRKAIPLGHLPWKPAVISALARGQLGGGLLARVAGSMAAFANWTEQDRYSDCAHLSAAAVAQRHTAADEIIKLHQFASINGKLP